MSRDQRGFVLREPADWWGTGRDDALHIALCEPKIPGNTGNVARLCAGASIWLHLIRPLGFDLDDRQLSRAGLDYWPHVDLSVHDDFWSFADYFPDERLNLFTKTARTAYTEMPVRPGTVLVFGEETTGLDDDVLEVYAGQQYRIPIDDDVRSLNLANACAVGSYEALRRLDWAPLGDLKVEDGR